MPVSYSLMRPPDQGGEGSAYAKTGANLGNPAVAGKSGAPSGMELLSLGLAVGFFGLVGAFGVGATVMVVSATSAIPSFFQA
jgi:hypothetical protein